MSSPKHQKDQLAQPRQSSVDLSSDLIPKDNKVKVYRQDKHTGSVCYTFESEDSNAVPLPSNIIRIPFSRSMDCFITLVVNEMISESHISMSDVNKVLRALRKSKHFSGSESPFYTKLAIIFTSIMILSSMYLIFSVYSKTFRLKTTVISTAILTFVLSSSFLLYSICRLQSILANLRERELDFSRILDKINRRNLLKKRMAWRAGRHGDWIELWIFGEEADLRYFCLVEGWESDGQEGDEDGLSESSEGGDGWRRGRRNQGGFQPGFYMSETSDFEYSDGDGSDRSSGSGSYETSGASEGEFEEEAGDEEEGFESSRKSAEEGGEGSGGADDSRSLPFEEVVSNRDQDDQSAQGFKEHSDLVDSTAVKLFYSFRGGRTPTFEEDDEEEEGNNNKTEERGRGEGEVGEEEQSETKQEIEPDEDIDEDSQQHEPEEDEKRGSERVEQEEEKIDEDQNNHRDEVSLESGNSGEDSETQKFLTFGGGDKSELI